MSHEPQEVVAIGSGVGGDAAHLTLLEQIAVVVESGNL